jgi:ABC-type multidrug transport system ATPase subunit
LSLQTGEIKHLKGINGSGKSTLLRCIIGLEHYQGNIRVAEESNVEIYRKQLGVVLDQPCFHEEMNGFTHIKWVNQIKPSPQEYIEELANGLGFDKKTLEQKVSTYSYGFRRKLSLLLALLGNPILLLLDEPFNGLDKNSMQFLVNYLQNRKEKVGILFTHHQASENTLVANKVLEVIDGKIVKIL